VNVLIIEWGGRSRQAEFGLEKIVLKILDGHFYVCTMYIVNTFAAVTLFSTEARVAVPQLLRREINI
jgi:hypothetical protein